MGVIRRRFREKPGAGAATSRAFRVPSVMYRISDISPQELRMKRLRRTQLLGLGVMALMLGLVAAPTAQAAPVGAPTAAAPRLLSAVAAGMASRTGPRALRGATGAVTRAPTGTPRPSGTARSSSPAPTTAWRPTSRCTSTTRAVTTPPTRRRSTRRTITTTPGRSTPGSTRPTSAST